MLNISSLCLNHNLILINIHWIFIKLHSLEIHISNQFHTQNLPQMRIGESLSQTAECCDQTEGIDRTTGKSTNGGRFVVLVVAGFGGDEAICTDLNAWAGVAETNT